MGAAASAAGPGRAVMASLGAVTRLGDQARARCVFALHSRYLREAFVFTRPPIPEGTESETLVTRAFEPAFMFRSE